MLCAAFLCLSDWLMLHITHCIIVSLCQLLKLNDDDDDEQQYKKIHHRHSCVVDAYGAMKTPATDRADDKRYDIVQFRRRSASGTYRQTGL